MARVMINDGAPPTYHACIFIRVSISSFVAVNGIPFTFPVIICGEGTPGESINTDNKAYAFFVLMAVSKCNVNLCDHKDGIREEDEEDGGREEGEEESITRHGISCTLYP